MKIFIGSAFRKCVWIALIGAFAVACQDEYQAPISDNFEGEMQLLRDNNVAIHATQEGMQTTSEVFEEEGISSARISTQGRIDGERFDFGHGCKRKITRSIDVEKPHRDTLIFRGTITIDYGDGTACGEYVRKGKIIDEFTYTIILKGGHSFYSAEKITYQGYVKDTTRLEGIFFVNSTKGQKTSRTQGASIHYPDGTRVLFDEEKTHTYHGGDSFSWKDNTITVTGYMKGKNRKNISFSSTIRTPLLYKYACDKEYRQYPLAGIIDGVVARRKSVIDYGDGSCDRIYTLYSVETGKTYTLEL